MKILIVCGEFFNKSNGLSRRLIWCISDRYKTGIDFYYRCIHVLKKAVGIYGVSIPCQVRRFLFCIDVNKKKTC